MTDLTSEPWFAWAVVVVIGLPLITIALTELRSHLVRRGNSLASPVNLLRTYVVPALALLILLRQIPNGVVANDGNWVRTVATVVGFLLLIFVLSSLNAALFLDAAQGSWRERLPSIFVDLGRIILIGIGLAVLFSQVWGTDVGGLFAALGVTSIVLGLALQNAVGGIISGLLLLFEQPFQLGDWLDTGSVRGRVVEVNWRAVHIETGNGVQIVPNAGLAGASFANLSRPSAAYTETLETTFTIDDPPGEVIALLNEVAASIPQLAPGGRAATVATGAGAYSTSLPLISIADAGTVRAQFVQRLWYAARRANLGLDGADIWKGESAADVEGVLAKFAAALHIGADDVPILAPKMDLERYTDGEIIQRGNEVAAAVRFVHQGQAQLALPLEGGGALPVSTLVEGDYVGQNALTRTISPFTVSALGQVTVLVVPAQVLDELVRANPRLARDVGHQIEQRRQLVEETREGNAPSRRSVT